MVSCATGAITAPVSLGRAYPSTANPLPMFACTPVNVAPVVPESRTMR
jgi:hypothetical protein